MSWIRFFWMTAVVFVATLETTAAAPAADDEQQADAELIRQWVEQLDSDSFFVREDASRRLSAAGEAAVGWLAEAAEGRGLEMTVRALDVLGQLCTSDDTPTVEAAEAVLQRLSQSGNPSVAARAKLALQPRNVARRSKAIETLRELGAELQLKDDRLFQVKLTKQWKGDQTDLVQLRWLSDVQSLIIQDVEVNDAAMKHLRHLRNLVILELNRTQLTDKGLEHLVGLPNLTSIQLANVDVTDAVADLLSRLMSHETRVVLSGVIVAPRVSLFGTKMTPQGAQQIRAARPDLNVDRRNGALLGVTGQANQDGCIIETVRAGTAADEAGIKYGDVITHFDDQQVADFVELTVMIGAKKPGDKATLKIRRGTTTFSREITFGSW